MLNKSKLLPLVVLLALASSAMAVIYGVKSSASGIPTLNSQSKQKDESNFDDDLPIFDPAAPTTKDEKKEARRKVKRKIDNTPTIPISSLEENDNITHIGVGGPPTALPVEQSNVIIIGEVTDAEAILSSDQRGLYSEFTVQIKKVLKNNTKESLTKGDSIFVERQGGRFKLPSGKLVTERVSETKMPLVGKKYILFLNKHPDDYFAIYTGYDLSGDKVTALDNYENNLTTKYNGVTAVKLLSDINLALADNSTALTTPE